ncbi:MAG: hypothetical protein HY961_00005, partial [Ignavibacteriae bacterium]|nr:hypothetical protein [Ignavibacteriota bacterium]
MRTIVAFLADYFRREWNVRYFSFVGVLLLASFVANFGFGLERRLLSHNPALQFAFYFFFYLIPYSLTILAYIFTTGRKDLLRNRGFIGLVVFCFALLSLYILSHNLPFYFFTTAPELFAP